RSAVGHPQTPEELGKLLVLALVEVRAEELLDVGEVGHVRLLELLPSLVGQDRVRHAAVAVAVVLRHPAHPLAALVELRDAGGGEAEGLGKTVRAMAPRRMRLSGAK